jgi:hypothetical protein
MANIWSLLTTVLTPVGATIITPASPRAAAVKALPCIEAYEVAGKNGEFLLNGTRVCHAERIQLTLSAATSNGLENLVTLVESVMDMNTTNWILSFPLGVGRTGYDNNPKTFYQIMDWLIQY